MEGMPVATLAAKKKGLVQELNGFIAQKKAVSEQAESMAELVGTSGGRKGATGPKTKESPSFVASLAILVLLDLKFVCPPGIQVLEDLPLVTEIGS